MLPAKPVASLKSQRIFLTHAEDWEAVGRVHGEFFGEIRPASTMVVVAALLNPAWRLEMEMEAVIPCSDCCCGEDDECCCEDDCEEDESTDQ
jgi:hypothetical protein